MTSRPTAAASCSSSGRRHVATKTSLTCNVPQYLGAGTTVVGSNFQPLQR